MVGKVAVMGLLEPHVNGGSKVRTVVLSGRRAQNFQHEVKAHIESGATIHTDAHHSYRGLNREYVHNVIDHAEKYVDGNVHTNGCENFWSLLKRALKGTYVAVEPFHLFRYLDEQVFRFNNRCEMNDADRFSSVICNIVGRRLTYKELIGAFDPAVAV